MDEKQPKIEAPRPMTRKQLKAAVAGLVPGESRVQVTYIQNDKIYTEEGTFQSLEGQKVTIDYGSHTMAHSGTVVAIVPINT